MKRLILFFLFAAIYTNGNSQWQQLTTYPSSSADRILFLNGYLYGCSVNSGVYRSSDEGASWTEINNNLITGDSRRIYDLQFIANKLFVATVDGIYVSSDNGDSWQRKSSGLTIGPGANNIFCFSVFENEGMIYTGTWNGIYYSTNSGENWNISNVSGEGVNIVSYIKYHGELYAGRDAINFPAVYKSTDNGFGWSVVNVWNNFPLSTFCFYAESDTLFIGTADGMWLSTNDGLNWSNRNTGLNLDPYVSSIVKTNSGNVMIASLKFAGSSVFKSYNNGLQWQEITDNLPFINEISELTIHGDKVYAGTSNKIWYRNINEIITAVSQNENITSQKYSLAQNYPNPFNPVTKINYELRITNYVSLKVFDILGNEVKTLVSETQNGGSHQVYFDGIGLTSGIYIYSIVSGGFSERKRMVLLK